MALDPLTQLNNADPHTGGQGAGVNEKPLSGAAEAEMANVDRRLAELYAADNGTGALGGPINDLNFAKGLLSQGGAAAIAGTRVADLNGYTTTNQAIANGGEKGKKAAEAKLRATDMAIAIDEQQVAQVEYLASRYSNLSHKSIEAIVHATYEKGEALFNLEAPGALSSIRVMADDTVASVAVSHDSGVALGVVIEAEAKMIANVSDQTAQRVQENRLVSATARETVAISNPELAAQESAVADINGGVDNAVTGRVIVSYQSDVAAGMDPAEAEAKATERLVEVKEILGRVNEQVRGSVLLGFSKEDQQIVIGFMQENSIALDTVNWERDAISAEELQALQAQLDEGIALNPEQQQAYTFGRFAIASRTIEGTIMSVAEHVGAQYGADHDKAVESMVDVLRAFDPQTPIQELEKIIAEAKVDGQPVFTPEMQAMMLQIKQTGDPEKLAEIKTAIEEAVVVSAGMTEAQSAAFFDSVSALKIEKDKIADQVKANADAKYGQGTNEAAAAASSLIFDVKAARGSDYYKNAMSELKEIAVYEATMAVEIYNEQLKDPKSEASLSNEPPMTPEVAIAKIDTWVTQMYVFTEHFQSEHGMTKKQAQFAAWGAIGESAFLQVIPAGQEMGVFPDPESAEYEKYFDIGKENRSLLQAEWDKSQAPHVASANETKREAASVATIIDVQAAKASPERAQMLADVREELTESVAGQMALYEKLKARVEAGDTRFAAVLESRKPPSVEEMVKDYDKWLTDIVATAAYFTAEDPSLTEKQALMMAWGAQPDGTSRVGIDLSVLQKAGVLPSVNDPEVAGYFDRGIARNADIVSMLSGNEPAVDPKQQAPEISPALAAAMAARGTAINPDGSVTLRKNGTAPPKDNDGNALDKSVLAAAQAAGSNMSALQGRDESNSVTGEVADKQRFAVADVGIKMPDSSALANLAQQRVRELEAGA